MLKKLPTLYKQTKTCATQVWTIFVDGDSFYTESGQLSGKMTRSSPTVCVGKNIGKANETTPEEQAEAEAQAKWEKKLSGAYKESLDDIEDGASYFEPMLAKKFEDEKHKIDWKIGATVQPKYDGIRAIITKDGATTRNGKEHKSIPHILKALEPIFKNDPSLILDGEIYNHELHEDFNKIASVVRKTKPTKEDLEESAKLAQFFCYDAPRIAGLSQKAPFVERYKEMKKVLEKINNDCIKVVPNLTANSEEEVKKCHDSFVSDGYEGIIVRISNAPYVNKRSDKLLKFKVFDTDEFTIEGVLAGKGNKSQMAGSVELHSKSGEYFTSNIKAPHDVLTNMLKNSKKYIGKVCTVRYFGLTPDKEIPRFPYVIDMDRWTYE